MPRFPASSGRAAVAGTLRPGAKFPASLDPPTGSRNVGARGRVDGGGPGAGCCGRRGPSGGPAAAGQLQRRLPRTASGRCRRRTTPARATAGSTRSTPSNVDGPAASRGPSPPACCAGTRRRRSSSASTMYVVTPFPNILYALDLTQAGRAVKWKYEPKPLARGAGRGLLRRRQPRRRLRRRQDLLQHARQPHRRASTRRPARSCGRRSSATSTAARR